MKLLRRSQERTVRARRGFALITVLLVLLAMLVLCAPFLLNSRNASRAGTQLADRAQARLALDAAMRHARGTLGGSHPALDTTPYWDTEEELETLPELDPRFFDARNDLGTIWNAEITDVAGKVDLNSAPPQLLANLLGATNRLLEPMKEGDRELTLSSTAGFAPTGYVWVDRELIRYGRIEGAKLVELQRGIGGVGAANGVTPEAGPTPPVAHAISAPVIDQRAFAPVLWRTKTPDGSLRRLDAPEQLRDTAQLALAIAQAAPEENDEERLSRTAATEALVAPLIAHGTTYGHLHAGREWQRPVRVLNAIVAGQTGILRVDELRWFSPGTTIEVTDGRNRELAVVQGLVDSGVRLMEPLQNDYFAYMAEVRPQVRRPVNVNVAEPELLEAVFANLQLNQKNERVTRDEARALAALIVESRPFDGMEDFLRRVLLPAAGLETLPGNAPVQPDALAGGGALIDALDAEAIFRNALNANDSYLRVSTVPFSFTSRDVFELDLRAFVNAQSGVERVALVREQVELVVPQEPLLQAWVRQEDLDEAFRLDREAPFWVTGPNSLQRWDSGATPPSNFVPHFGTLGGQAFVAGVTQTANAAQGQGTEVPVPQHVFASREDDGWAQLWASREPDNVQGLSNRHVQHFDHETGDAEGRYLAANPVTRTTQELGWLNTQNSLLRAFHAQLWFKPQALGSGTLVDVGRTSVETDRVRVGIDGQDLVVRVYDGSGDHPGSAGYIEVGEMRFALAPGDGPGLAAQTWSHLAFEVHGNKPSQMSLLVDGRSFGVRKPGQTRLTSGLAQGATQFAVESLEGFPDPCVVRIGNELIECVHAGGNALSATPALTGANSGFGGRLARVPFVGGEAGVPSALNVDVDHPAGATVELYGYASILGSNVPAGSARLPGTLGAWTVARAVGVVGGSGTLGDPISHAQILASMGYGIEGNSTASALRLGVCDPNEQIADVMSAFSPQGGYALLVQLTPGTIRYFPNGQPQQNSTQHTTANNTPLFGYEIIRYSGWSGDLLQISARAALPTGDPVQGPHAFVVNWDPNWQIGASGTPIAATLNWQTYVVPISVPAPGASGLTGFLPANNGSEFAQLTRIADAQFTEWLRYDTISGDGHLVRNEPTALQALRQVLTLGGDGSDVQGGVPNGGGGGGGGGGPTAPGGTPGGGPGGGPTGTTSFDPSAPEASSAASSALLASPQPTQPVAAQSVALWQAWWGASEDANLPLTHAARTTFQFRGVCGTYSHDHPAGTEVLPVWRVQRNGVDGGEPGRFDYVMLMDDTRSSLGWPARVHRSYRPVDRTVTSWRLDPTNTLQPQTDTSSVVAEDGVVLARNAVMVALDAQARAPVPMTVQGTGTGATLESRALARMTKHPSGELPRDVSSVVVGQSIRGADTFDALCDELIFHTTSFGDQQGAPTQGGLLVLTQDLPDGGGQMTVAPQVVRIPWGNYGQAQSFLNSLPQDAGLMLVGDEIVCYDGYDNASGTINIPQGGRGLLGTLQGTHEAGTTAMFLEHFIVGTLAGGIGPGDSTLPLVDTTGFPPSGTVLVGTELIHYTRLAGSGLDMPRRSTEPGRKDGRGDGLFRGRFGTVPNAHAAGTPVILFPYRYSDRWTEKSDAPELGYFGLTLDQPNAHWRTSFFSVEEPSSGLVKVETLQRLSNDGEPLPPWDGEPGVTKGLALLREGMPEGVGHRIGKQADRAEWRVHVRYQRGAFDEQNGLAHGWKQTPRLRALGAEFTAPSLVLRRVDE
jgi:type II secretory pathway pseudopilin PulG